MSRTKYTSNPAAIPVINIVKAVGILILLICISQRALSQFAKTGPSVNIYNASRHVKAGNSAISVFVDRVTGQFWFETVSGIPLLFVNGDGITSYTNVRLNGETFTNNDLHNPQTPAFTSRMPYGTAVADPDKVVFFTTCSVRGQSLAVRQEFIPSLENDFAFVHVRTTLKNLSASTIRSGLQLMLDVFVDTDDRVLLTVDNAPVKYERQWLVPDIPGEWRGNGTNKAIVVRGRLSGPGLTTPHHFIAGRWQYAGYLGAAAWNYGPSGLPINDAAVLLKWNEQTILPGDSITISTDYGYDALLEAGLRCRAAEIRLAPDSGSYAPNPFPVTATVFNTGTIAIDSFSINLTLPPQTHLAPNETALKKRTSRLAPNDSVEMQWLVIADYRDTAATASFMFEIVAPASLHIECYTSTVIPAMPKFSAGILCPDSVVLSLSADGYSYMPDPFDVVIQTVNNGTVPLSNLNGHIRLPSELSLVAGTPDQALLPALLAPGDTARTVWKIHPAAQRTPTSLVLSISVSGGHGVADSCEVIVRMPAVKDVPQCIANGVTTKGSEFWTAFLPNNTGTAEPEELCLFIAAGEDTQALITSIRSHVTDTIFIPAGSLRLATVDKVLDDALPEQIQDLGVLITTDKPVTLFQGNLRSRHSDASIVLPSHAVGTSYSTVGYNWESPYEHFIIVSTEDRTNINVTPYSLTSIGTGPGQLIQLTLDKGQTYYVKSGITGSAGGLTGSRITSDKPVVVITGAESGWIPENTLPYYAFLNPHYEQMMPDVFLGTEYVAVPFRSRKGGDTFKALATEDNTEVTIGSNPPVLISSANESHEFLLTGAARIVSTKPIVLAQFANSALWDSDSNEYGDGSMVILSPADRYAACHEFPSGLFALLPGYENASPKVRMVNRPIPSSRRAVDPDTIRAAYIQQLAVTDSSFVSIVAYAGGPLTVSLDGKMLPDTMFHAVAGGGFVSAAIQLQPGFHRLGTGDTRGIGVTVYGFTYHDAYSFNAGFLVTKKKAPVLNADAYSVPYMLSLAPPYPNPVSTHTRISFTLPERLPIRIELLDMLGRVLSILVEGTLAAGAHQTLLRCEALPPGMYSVVLHSGKQHFSRQLFVFR